MNQEKEKVDLSCTFCAKVFQTKRNLDIHIISNKKCLERRKVDTVYSCSSCDYSTGIKGNLKKHTNTCKKVKTKRSTEERDLEINKIRVEKDIIISKQQEEFSKLLEDKTIKIREMTIMLNQKDRQIRDLKELLEKSIQKPSVSNHTTIGGNQYVSTILSDQYERQVDPKRVEELCRNEFDKYIWQGQKGVALFCNDHIIRTADGKMVLCCTDPTRKRFKYKEDGEVKEDLDARTFTENVSRPIKMVSREMFDAIHKDLEEQRMTATNGFEMNLLDTKMGIALEKMVEISNVDDNRRNTDYKTELCIVTNV